MDDRHLDFRLLECLKVLVDERHVTRAAERLGLSQPKLSGVLARLRQVTGDPLLVRTPEGMTPTPLALELAAHSSEFLDRWRNLVSRETVFKAEESHQSFTIAALDAIAQDLVVTCAPRIRQEAPGMSIELSGVRDGGTRAGLERGEIDLVLAWNPDLPPDFLISQLTVYSACCVVSAEHPRIRDHLDLETFARESHVQVTRGRKHVPSIFERRIDDFLTSKGMERHIGFYSHSVMLVPELVANTDLISTIPRHLAQEPASRLNLRLFEPPLPLPKQEIAMIWHARTTNDPGNRWLRNVLRQAAQRRTAGRDASKVEVEATA